MKRIMTLVLALVLALGCIFTALAEETDMAGIMAEYDLTAEDIEYVANIVKQLNEGNDPHLESKGGYYDIELKLAKLGAAMGNGELAKWVGEIYQGGNVEGVDEAEAVGIAIEWW